MRLRFIDDVRALDRKALKPAIGDTVLFESQKYLVKEVGLKYVRATKEGGNNALYVIKIQDVVKWYPDVPGSVSPNLNFTP